MFPRSFFFGKPIPCSRKESWTRLQHHNNSPSSSLLWLTSNRPYFLCFIASTVIANSSRLRTSRARSLLVLSLRTKMSDQTRKALRTTLQLLCQLLWVGTIFLQIFLTQFFYLGMRLLFLYCPLKYACSRVHAYHMTQHCSRTVRKCRSYSINRQDTHKKTFCWYFTAASSYSYWYSYYYNYNYN